MFPFVFSVCVFLSGFSLIPISIGQKIENNNQNEEGVALANNIFGCPDDNIDLAAPVVYCSVASSQFKYVCNRMANAADSDALCKQLGWRGEASVSKEDSQSAADLLRGCAGDSARVWVKQRDAALGSEDLILVADGSLKAVSESRLRLPVFCAI